MATKFYFPSSGASPASPAYSSDWEQQATAARLPLKRSKSLTVMTTVARTDDSSNANQDVLFRQYVSETLATQTFTAQQIQMVIRCKETVAASNLYLAANVRSWDNSTTFQTLLATTIYDAETTTVLTNRKFSATSSTVSIVLGDRLVIEFGLSGDPSSSNNHNGSMVIGDTAAADLVYNSTGTTDSNPWLTFANTVYFAGKSISKPSFLTGLGTTKSNKPSYSTGTNPSYNTTDNSTAYLTGISYRISSKPSYQIGSSIAAPSSKSAYLSGIANTLDNQTAYLSGISTALSNKSAFLTGSISLSDSRPAYLSGQITAKDNRASYLEGTPIIATPVSVSAYLCGKVDTESNNAAFLHGKQEVRYVRFPSTPILDDFNRDDGPIGDDWDGPLISFHLLPSVKNSQLFFDINNPFRSAYYNRLHSVPYELYFDMEYIEWEIFIWFGITHVQGPTGYEIELVNEPNGTSYVNYINHWTNGVQDEAISNIEFSNKVYGVGIRVDGNGLLYFYTKDENNDWHFVFFRQLNPNWTNGYFGIDGSGWYDPGDYIDNFGGGTITVYPGQSAFITGTIETSSQAPCYLSGIDTNIDNLQSYTIGQDSTLESTPAYLSGANTYIGNSIAYLEGITSEVNTSIAAYMDGTETPKSSKHAFLIANQARVTSVGVNIEYRNAIHSRVSSIGVNVETAIQLRPTISSVGVQIEYINTKSSNQTAYLSGPSGLDASSSAIAYLEGTGQSLFPISDIETGNWINESYGESLYPSLADNSDDTYAWSQLDGVGSHFEVKLGYPGSIDTGDHIIRWRAYRKSGILSVTLRLELLDGESVITSDTQTLTDSIAEYTKFLTAEEVLSITNYANLKIRVTIEEII